MSSTGTAGAPSSAKGKSAVAEDAGNSGGKARAKAVDHHMAAAEEDEENGDEDDDEDDDDDEEDGEGEEAEDVEEEFEAIDPSAILSSRTRRKPRVDYTDPEVVKKAGLDPKDEEDPEDADVSMEA